MQNKENNSAAALVSKLDKVTIPAARNAIIMEHLGESKGFKVESAEEKGARNDKRAEVLSGLYRILADEKTGPSLSNQVLSIATVVQGYCSKEALDKDGVREAIDSLKNKLAKMAKDINPEIQTFVTTAFKICSSALDKMSIKTPLKTQSAPSPEPVNRTYLSVSDVPSQTYGSASQALRSSAPEQRTPTTTAVNQVGQFPTGAQQDPAIPAPPTKAAPTRQPTVTVGTYQATPQYQTLPVAPKGTISPTGFQPRPTLERKSGESNLSKLQAERAAPPKGLGK